MATRRIAYLRIILALVCVFVILASAASCDKKDGGEITTAPTSESATEAFVTNKFPLEFYETHNEFENTRQIKVANDKTLTVIFSGMTEIEGNPVMGGFNEVKVYDSTGALLQTINLVSYLDGESFTYAPEPKDSIMVEDMNFDGHEDFRLIKATPASSNVPYLYFLWDAGTNAFVYNEALAEITSPVFDADNKFIVSFVAESANISYENIYQYIDGKATLTKSTKTEITVEKDQNGQEVQYKTTTVSELKDGKLIVTSEDGPHKIG